MDVLILLSLAMVIDLTLGEPPGWLHPVVGMGKVISCLEKAGLGRRPSVQFIYGAGMTLVTIGLFAIPAYFLLLYLKNFSFIAYVIVGGVLLKATFALRELRRAAFRVRELLLDAKLEEARRELRSLVSRDTRGLAALLVVSATVESVAENTVDSLVAPLFYFLLLGIPGAIGYRVVNTLDAMIGYHGKYEYLGKFASRLDDVLNFIPARLTALLLVFASFLSGRGARASWQAALSEHARTASPNAGWTMAAVAGALNVELEKTGHYRLGRAGTPLTPGTIAASVQLMQIAGLIWVMICLVVGGISLVLASPT